MPVSEDLVAQLQLIKQQQALLTQALAAQVNGVYTGEPPSIEAFLVALDPSFADKLASRTPRFDDGAPAAWWDRGTAPVRQRYSWNCSCASTSWVLQSMGFGISQDDVIARLGPGRVNPTYGLMDGSGAALEALITEVTGWSCGRGYLSYDQVYSLAGVYPMALGLHGMYHWIACVDTDGAGGLVLANPAPGYDGVRDHIDRDTFNRFGPVSAVWCKGPG
jgi:hypothetical protein